MLNRAPLQFKHRLPQWAPERRFVVAFVLVAILIGASWVFKAPGGSAPLDVSRLNASFLSDTPVNPALTERLIESLHARLQQKPDDARSLSLLGAAYLQRAREVGDPAYYGKAEAALTRALAFQPDDFETLTAWGSLALARHQFRSALDYGQRAHALNPFSARALGVIADAQIELGDYDNAVQTIDRMASIRPDMSSYARISYARELHGDSDGALTAMRMAVEAGSVLAENRAWARTHVALLLFNRGDLDGAQREYEAALQALPSYIPAQAGRARVLVARGDLTGAIALYERATRILPLAEYVIALGDSYALAGRADDAKRQYALVETIAHLQRVNGVDIDLEMTLFEADYADAQRDSSETLARALRVYQDRPTIYAADALAWTLYRAGRFDEARGYAQTALKLNTQDALLWFHAGMIDARLDRTDEAKKKLEHALRLNPHFSLRWAAIARQTLSDLKNSLLPLGEGPGMRANSPTQTDESRLTCQEETCAPQNDSAGSP